MVPIPSFLYQGETQPLSFTANLVPDTISFPLLTDLAAAA